MELRQCSIHPQEWGGEDVVTVHGLSYLLLCNKPSQHTGFYTTVTLLTNLPSGRVQWGQPVSGPPSTS